jgi:uncharacterized protein
MKFWDASALVPLLIEESTTERVQSLASSDPVLLVWWGTHIECASAVARLEREGLLEDAAAELAFRRLRELADAWHQIDPSDAVQEIAVRLLRVHPLRAAGALQLAAAVVAAEGRPPTLTLVTLDDRLGAAARKEGFIVVDPASAN